MLMIRDHVRLVCLLALCLRTLTTAAHPLDHWVWRNPKPGGLGVWAIAYGGGQYVGVGVDGAVATSLDGVNWLQRAAPTSEWLVDVAFGDGQFVAVGVSGTILTSRDGIAWTSRASLTNQGLSGVIWHDGTFVAVGSYGTLLTSLDGIDWVQRDPRTTCSLRDVTYGDRFVAVGIDGAIISSLDGIAWVPATGMGNHWFHEVVYANGRYVASASYGRFAMSLNGVNWTVSTNQQFSYFGTLASGNGLIVAIPDGVVHTSVDGVTWRPRQRVMAGAITYGGGQFVIAGSPAGATSPDGIRWTARSSDSYDTFRALAIHNDLMVAAGEGSFYTSTNGVDWESRDPAPSYRSRDLIWADGKFVAVGFSGQIQTSTNGTDWEPRASQTLGQLEGIAWGNGRFVAVGTGGFLVSSNAIAWQALNRGGVTWWKDVIYADGRFVAVGDHGRIAVSTNGLEWVFRTIDYDDGYNSITYGNGVWVVVGALTSTRYSTNLTDWFEAARGGLLYTVSWANGVFLGGGRNGRLFSSTNGIDWTDHAGKFGYLYGLTWYRGSFWGVGSGGAIQQSDPWEATAPSFVHQPSGAVTPAGTTVSLRTECNGSSFLSYQWTKDGVLLSGETNAVLVLTNVQSDTTGSYRVIISNSVGTVTSDEATINLATPSQAAAQLAVSPTGPREFTLQGRPGNRYVISYSRELGSSSSWIPLKTITLPHVAPFEPFVWIDETATNAAGRFYRAEWEPQ